MCVCTVCGKHYMRHLAGGIWDYVHYDYSKMCTGGTDER